MTSIILAGGGTAGHVNPLLATALTLREMGLDVRAVGTADGLEKDLVPAAGFELFAIERVPFPRRPGRAALTFPARFRRAISQAEDVLDGVSVAVGFGGFASTPVYAAAKRRGIPVVIHEQNAKPGLANRYGARFAHAVALTFPSTPLRARRGVTQTVGLPLRPAIATLAAQRAMQTGAGRTRAAQRLGLDPTRATLVVTGGSLGAQHLNEVVTAALDAITAADIQVLHLTGRGKDGPVRQAVADRSNYVVLDYLAEMEDAYAAADLVLCRSGAGTVAELGALGLPAVFVPLAVGNGEQARNASDLVAAGGAKLINDREFTVERFIHDVLALVADKNRLDAMGAAARETSPLDGAGRLAQIIADVGEAYDGER
ncbi:undecaprenyldiphospho-muramoylpentapeptide beta-N-acetylglucosaminyltransferase [Actinobaculum sp. 352]|uniref:undecaprenyldiphospho-muramoylpentapeptide beta-N-acetylglucosaminyltransferase n=1 Tax=Actinobaculum sp. 352 TaxID=2490946 RepID=UPI000F7F7F15|nr:undecaprenyldiphospho-muramoylpentapeptide beta-N-acetylglucosaminyltransferase [Actinobaculum sp. 352]RTE48114.1 undecaprenyldiphospho-muramoylpentapeptide beta-N-acetylglucosaminyltransferase [Actinobaculum sp. 352]